MRACCTTITIHSLQNLLPKGFSARLFILFLPQDLVETFNFHNFDNIRFTTRKMDPCMRMVETQANVVVDLLFSAYNGDVTAIRRYVRVAVRTMHAHNLLVFTDRKYNSHLFMVIKSKNIQNLRFYIPTHQPAHNIVITIRVYMHLCMLTRHSNLLD